MHSIQGHLVDDNDRYDNEQGVCKSPIIQSEIKKNKSKKFIKLIQTIK